MAIFHGLFNKLYMGKNKKDVTKEDMPTNPFLLFFDILSTHAGDLVKLSLLMSVACLPILVWGNINFQAMLGYDMSAGDNLAYYLLIFTIGLAPCLLLAGIGQAGMTAVTCRYGRDMYAWVWTDFRAGIKENWKKALLMSFLNGLVIFICTYVTLMYREFYATTGTSIYYFLSYFILIVLAVFLSVNIYYWPMLVMYDLPFRKLFKYSITLAIMKLPFTLLFGFITFLPAVIALIVAVNWAPGIYIGIIFYAAFGFAFMELLQSFFAVRCFKKHIQDADAREEEIHKTESKPNKKKDELKGVWSFLDDLDSKNDGQKK